MTNDGRPHLKSAVIQLLRLSMDIVEKPTYIMYNGGTDLFGLVLGRFCLNIIERSSNFVNIIFLV